VVLKLRLVPLDEQEIVAAVVTRIEVIRCVMAVNLLAVNGGIVTPAHETLAYSMSIREGTPSPNMTGRWFELDPRS